MLTLLLFAALASGAEEPWAKVRELPGGSELRIYKTGAKSPLLATLYSASADALVVIVKNAQMSISKDRIERLDARPPQSGSRLSMETRKTIGTREAAATGRVKDSSLPPSSTAGSVKLKSRPGFETVYRR